MKLAALLALVFLAGGCATPPAEEPLPPRQDFTSCPRDASPITVVGYDWLNGRPNYIVLQCDWYQHVFRLPINWPTNVPPPR